MSAFSMTDFIRISQAFGLSRSNFVVNFSLLNVNPAFGGVF